MDIPQSKTNDCLLSLAESTEELPLPPKPPYPKLGFENLQYEHQYIHPENSLSLLSLQTSSNTPPSQPSAQKSNLTPPKASSNATKLKVHSNCKVHNLEAQKTPVNPRRPSRISFIGYKYSQAVIQDPSTGCFMRFCCRGWMGVLQLIIALRAILARCVFLALTLTIVVTVVRSKGENAYWLLCFLMLPLLIDLCYSIGLVVAPSRVQDKSEKWFTKCLLAYLFCACPPIWIIELHQLQQLNEAADAIISGQGLHKPGEPIYAKNPWVNAGLVYNEPGENLVIMGDSVESYLNALAKSRNISLPKSVQSTTSSPSKSKSQVSAASLIGQPPSSGRTKRSAEDSTIRFPTQEESLIQAVTLQHYPLKMRVRMMEQLLLLSVIVGRWVLPRFGISRDQLSQLLLINIGNAADILELFEAFNEEAVRTNTSLKISILCLWQASLFQFCFNKTAILEKPVPQPNRHPSSTRSVSRSTTFNDLVGTDQAHAAASSHPEAHVISSRRTRTFCDCFSPRLPDEPPAGCCQLWFGTELWAIFMSLILQDVPFLALRLTLVMHFNVRSYSNIFFTCKNSLLILLQIFRSVVILGEFRRSWINAQMTADIPMILMP